MGALRMMDRKIKTYGVLFAILILGALAVYGTGSDEKPPIIYNYPTIGEIAGDPELPTSRRMSINARSVLVVDNSSGAWLYAKKALETRPIASLTKLLTAMVYLDTHPNLDTVVYISGRDCYKSAKSHLREGEGYKASELLSIALMASDNRAARALATASEIPRRVFVERMNAKARQLGMMNTKVFEVTGLDERNVSTAADIATMVNAAMQYPQIKKISSTYRLRLKVRNKKRYKNFVNTNRLVLSRWHVKLGKTGFIRESDYCLGTVLKNRSGQEITVVVLGSPTNSTRFRVARKLAVFGFKYAGRMKNGANEIAGR
jgi:D-alanyl-D-alanine endopeptidase (penicillin-binding protein 7)